MMLAPNADECDAMTLPALHSTTLWFWKPSQVPGVVWRTAAGLPGVEFGATSHRQPRPLHRLERWSAEARRRNIHYVAPTTAGASARLVLLEFLDAGLQVSRALG